MSKEKRTILEEIYKEDGQNPEDIHFSIIRLRLPGSGGYLSDVVECYIIDYHYLLISLNTPSGRFEPFGIVDLNKPKTAISKMYTKAKTVANRRAEIDGNKFIDLTSRVKITPEEEVYRFYT